MNDSVEHEMVQETRMHVPMIQRVSEGVARGFLGGADVTGTVKRLSTEGATRRMQQHAGTIVRWREKERGQVGRWIAGVGICG